MEESYRENPSDDQAHRPRRLIHADPVDPIPGRAGGQPAGTTETMEGQRSIHEAAVSLFLHLDSAQG